MNLNWSNRVIKYVLFVFNLLFVISGIIMIAVGVAVKSYYTDYDTFLNGSYFSLPNLLIAIGSLIFFISFFGCCGAIRESWFMIFIFSILLSIIFIMEFSAGIAGYVLRDKTASYLETKLIETMPEYQFNGKANDITFMWDTIQYEFECCGATGPKDWPDVRNKTKPTVPTPTDKPATTAPSDKPATPVPSDKPTPPAPSDKTTTHQPETTTPNATATTPASGGKRKRAAPASQSEPLQGDPNDLPASCCKPVTGATGTTVCNLNQNSTATYHKTGCVVGFGDYLKDHAVTLGGVGIAIAFIQLFGVIFACHLARQLKHGFYST